MNNTALFLLILKSQMGSEFKRLDSKSGCPPVIDNGLYDHIYKKPTFCKTLLPTTRNISETPEPEPSPFWIKLYYSYYSDIFRVKVSTDSNYTIYELWITTHKVEPDGKLRRSPVGNFEKKYDFSFYCCDRTNLRTVAHYIRNRASGPSKSAEVIWSPLQFKGHFLFRANIFISSEKWYSNVISKVYVMPPHIPNFLRSSASKNVLYWQSGGESEEHLNYSIE